MKATDHIALFLPHALLMYVAIKLMCEVNDKQTDRFFGFVIMLITIVSANQIYIALSKP